MFTRRPDPAPPDRIRSSQESDVVLARPCEVACGPPEALPGGTARDGSGRPGAAHRRGFEGGGHFAPSLGVTELTVALHYVFETPRDRLVWDTGHQGYIHKILTGRNEAFPTIRQYGGLAPFLRRDESEYDTFAAGHAATSISAALGMAQARDLRGTTTRSWPSSGTGP
jgi:hypothetical protein